MQFPSSAILTFSIVLFAQFGAAADVDYQRDVKPVLKSRCYACHGALKQESNLRLDTAKSIRRGGDGGPAVAAGEPTDSELISRITAEDESIRMPPEGHPLSADEIEKIVAWIESGASGPDDEQPEQDPRAHWAFQPPVRPELAYAAAEWGANPIDAILAAEQHGNGLTRVAAAEKSLQLRRLYLDLIGLPPTRSELHEFQTNQLPGAWAQTVDRLLASPAYGERWGRHWMDVWRYSDWYGLGEQVRYSQPHIWHWRDWIVESLNADAGYDQMLREMLSADEIAPTDVQTLRATGFLARNYFLFNRTTWLDGTIEHTSKAFLGLTLNCTKCHDHKYDPISQQDYYAFRAFFEPHQIRHDSLPGQIDLEQDALPRAFDSHPDAPTHLHVGGNEKDSDTSHTIDPAVPAVLDFTDLDITEIALPDDAHFPMLRSFVLQDHLRAAEREIADAASAGSASENALADRGAESNIARLRAAAANLHPSAIRTAYAADVARHHQAGEVEVQTLVSAAARAAAEYRLAFAEWAVARDESKAATAQGESAKSKAAVALQNSRQELTEAKQVVESPGKTYTSLVTSLKSLEGPDETEESRRQPYPHVSTGRRTALAGWMTDRRNPLTARVAVNHIWMRHFGRPLVEPVNDFGRRTQRPALQALLDWLAVEFMESGWNMKHLHRLIVTSQAYRLSDEIRSTDERTRERDPDNQYVWRREPMRMQSQVVRDSLLHLAGLLDRRMGGPTIDPNSTTHRRRSLYFTHSRDDRNLFVSMFDDADILRCYRRSESIIPQQALALINAREPQYAAMVIAGKLSSVATRHGSTARKSREVFVKAAFETVLCRAPDDEEMRVCLETYAAVLASPPQKAKHQIRARMMIVLALLNHNDFITIR